MSDEMTNNAPSPSRRCATGPSLSRGERVQCGARLIPLAPWEREGATPVREWEGEGGLLAFRRRIPQEDNRTDRRR